VERFRWPLLFVGALVAGASCYLLIGFDDVPRLLVMGGMLVGVGWFYLKDHEIDSYKP
jgi:uncharacterized membrane protein